jgi:hypothetical protein
MRKAQRVPEQKTLKIHPKSRDFPRVFITGAHHRS